MSTFRRIGFIAVAAILLIGCQSYREGNSRTFGEFTDDTAIQSKLKLSLIGDEEISGWRINTEVRKGVVTLYGRVPSDAIRNKALSKARAVKGVVEVEDRLTVVTE